MNTLLLIDDDRDVLLINKQYFARKGYAVKCAPNASAGIVALDSFSPDCILLDVMMPKMNGFEACEQLRAKSTAPILFLTGKLDEASKVRGLLLGGDDYIAKPYGLAELEARIVANIRRSKMTQQAGPTRLFFTPLEIDIVAHQVYYKGESIRLGIREYDLLYLLATCQNQIVSFEQIAEQLWGSYREEDRSTVMVNMSRLRKKLEQYPDMPHFIETVWGKGYIFSPLTKPL